MNTSFIASVWTTVHANDNDAFIPEVWAAESLLILENNVVASMLVHRNFENAIAQFGDTVNTRLHGTFTARRKTDADSVTVQDASSTNVAVKLDQHLHTSFLIKDGEESKGFKVLRDEYLVPGMVSLAQQLDEIIVSQLYHFRHQSVGQLGVTPTRSLVTAARGALNELRVPTQGRKLLVGTNTETALLNIDDFVQADKLGDEGTAMREGSLGKKFGMEIFMDQNVPSVKGTAIAASGLINAGNLTAGSTVLTVDTFTGTLPLIAGAWLVIAGDLTPLQIVSSVGAGTPTSITVAAPGLREAIVDGAAITVYDSGQINFAGGYALEYGKKLTLDELTAAPKKGQMFSIGAPLAATGETATIYAATNGPDRSVTEAWLDRPLRLVAADDAVVGLGPDGEYNFAFHENAIALVTRPLAPPQAGTGALSTVMNWRGYSLRVTITYSGTQQGHLVTLDILAGVKVLDTRLGVVVYA